MSSNQGAGNAGKLLKVDTDGSVITAEVAGATVDDEMSTVSTNPVQNKVITETITAVNDRVDYLEDQLYDTYEIPHVDDLMYDHRGIENPYLTSTFTGWACTIGHPRYIHKIVVPFKVRTGKAVSKFKLGLFKLTAPITDADFSDSVTYPGLPIIGNKLVKVLEKIVELEEPITEVGDHDVEFVLDEQIDNAEGADYIIDFMANNWITYGYGRTDVDPMTSGYVPGMGWNSSASETGPWDTLPASVTDGKVGVANAQYNTSNVNVRTAAQQGVYYVATAQVFGDWIETETKIHTDAGAKFTELVEDATDGRLDLVPELDNRLGYLENTLEDERIERIDHVSYDEAATAISPYVASTFSGWYGAVGHPEKVNYAIFRIRPRGVDYPITKVTGKVYKLLHPITEDDYDKNAETGLPTGRPTIGPFLRKVFEATVELDNPITTEITDVRIDFPETFENSDGLELIAGYQCNNYVSGGPLITTVPAKRPWNTETNLTGPWAHYTTWDVNSQSTYSDPDNIINDPRGKLNMSGNCYETENASTPAYRLEAATIGWEEVIVHNEIYTDADAKFTNLVGEALDNCDDFDQLVDHALDDLGLREDLDDAKAAAELVEPATIVEYQGSSSLNLVENPTSGYTYSNPASTFDGECFPIGPVPAEVPIGGFRVPLKIRSLSDDTDVGFRTANLAKVELWACDYTMENGTTAWSGSGSDPNFNPVKVAEKSIEIDLDLDNPEKLSGVYDFVFDEPFYNTEGKHLYLAYFINARIYRPKVNGVSLLYYLNNKYNLGLTSVKSFYSAFTAKQTTVPANIGKSNRWQNDLVIAFSIITAHDGYIASDLFNEWVDDRTETSVVEQVEDYLSHHSLPVPPSYEVRLAKKYYAVKGDKLQLFYDGLVKGVNPSKTADVVVNCSVGAAYPRYWEFTPNADNVGHSYPLTLAVRNFQGQVISSMTTSIEVVDVPTYDTATSYSMLGFGDSLTSSGTWFGEGLRRLVGTATSGVSGPASLQVPNLSLTSYGKKSATNNTYLVHHEGYGGWTWGSFLQTSSSASTVNGIFVTLTSAPGWDINIYQHSIWIDQNNKQWKLEDIDGAKIKFDRGPGNTGKQSETQLPTILDCASLSQSIASSDIVSTTWESGNPFYDDDTGRVNFVAHATELGAQPADIVSCLLTWNGGGGPSSPSAGWAELPGKINTHMANATTLLRDIHNDLPNAKIICVGIQLSSVTGGNGQNYGAVGSYSDTFGTNYYAFDYDQALENLVTNEEFGQYCYYVDTKGQFDTEDLMPYTSVAKNTRSSNTENRGTNGVHPSTAGYYAIGDAYFRTLVKVLNDIHS